MAIKNATPEHFYNQLRRQRKYLPEWSKLSLADKKAVASKLRQLEDFLGDIYREHRSGGPRFGLSDARFLNPCSEIPLKASRKPSRFLR